MNKSIPYGRQNITQSDIEAVTETLKADFLTQGPKILEFEKNFAKYVDAKYAVAVSNGTTALHLSVLSLGLQKGDQVITTPITFAASANCIRYAGGEVLFSDIDRDTYLIDLNKIEDLLKKDSKSKVKGIIPVDFTGLPVDIQQLKTITDKYGVWVVEDACHSPGGGILNNNRLNKCGNGLADTSVFSFHPVKHIAAGEGGMITTNNKSIYNHLLQLRTHGITKQNLDYNIPYPELQGDWYYEQQELGYNYRITDIQAALGNSQLNRAEEGVYRRQEIAKLYRNAFNGSTVKCQKIPKNAFHAYHLFVIEVEDRKGLYEHLRKKNIFSQVHYIPVHLMPDYQKLGWKAKDFPCAEDYYNKCLSLPMYPTLSDDEIQFVITSVLEYTNK